jgi:hypothetical protein
MPKVFISYGRRDLDAARRLFNQLRVIENVEPWFDKESLLPGISWRPAIRKAIREANYFLALISSNSVSGKGFRNTELAQALEILTEFPPDQIFLIPARLDECQMPRDELTELNWIDLFPDWEPGIERLLLVFAPSTQVRSGGTDDSRSTNDSHGGRSNGAEKEVSDKIRSGYHYRVGLVDLDLGLTNLKPLAQVLNETQGFFLFTCPEMPSVKDAVGDVGGLTNLRVHEIPSSFFAEHPNLTVDLVVCLTRYPLAFREDDGVIYNYFAGESEQDERFLFVSTDQLYAFSKQAGRTFEEGLVHTIVGQLVNYFTKIGYHTQTRDCVMDHCKVRADQVRGLKSRKFCDSCGQSLPEGDLKAAIEALLRLDY